MTLLTKFLYKLNALAKYKILLDKAIERIPFISYIQRLCFFIKHPNIEEKYVYQQQREMSFVDIFNALGLLAIIVSLIILYDRSFNEFKIILAFNPLFVVFSWVVNAIVFSSACACVLTISISLSASPRKLDWRKNFYNLFTHGLRCYAAFGLFLGLPFIKMCGDTFLNGLNFEESLSGLFWFLYVFTVLGFLSFRLVINPYNKYCKVLKAKCLNWLFILFIVCISFLPLKIMPLDYEGKILDEAALCDLFKKGDFIKKIPLEMRQEAMIEVCGIQ